MPAAVTNVKVKCPGCKSPVPLAAEAVRELSARLAVQVKCPKCGRERSVSALRTPQQPGTTPANLPAKGPAPFRPLLAVEAGSEPKSTPRNLPTPQPAPAPESSLAPFEALNTSPVAVPFAPLEATPGQAVPTKVARPKRSLGAWWRELPVARRQLLATVVALAFGSLFLGTALKRNAPSPAAATTAEPAEQPLPPESTPTADPPTDDAREPAAEPPTKKPLAPPADAKPNPFRPEGP